MQQQFNTDTFKTETAIYAQEGVAGLVGTIEFADNQDVLDIIGGKGGVLRMLDEEVKFGTRGSSASFFKKMCKQHAQPEPKKGKSSKALITTKAHSSWFKVKHFAGIVQYESDSFLEKNKDTLNQDMVDLLAESSDPLIKLLFAPKVDDAAAAEAESKSTGGRRRKKKGAKTVSSQFRASLSNLMKSIKSTESHYIRCIKSNQLKSANTFHEANVLDQLRTGGVFSAADIRTKGFPFRKSHRKFVQHFGVFAYDLEGIEQVPAKDADEKAFASWCDATVTACAAMSGVNANFSKQIIVGSSMVLYQSAAHQDLENMRASVLDKAANVCQGSVEGDREKAFAVFDSTQRGTLSVDEIRHIMTNLGEKISEDVLEDLMTKVTFDEKGCVAISQLSAW